MSVIASNNQRMKFPEVNAERRDFLRKVEEKWQRRWEESGLFEADPDPSRPKFFVTFPYPYINSFPHLGTAYTVLRVDILARFKRMQGFNVLFPQGWHATGGPIVAAALRVREGDEKQIRILKSIGIPDSEIPKFRDPEYWVEFFRKGFKQDFSRYGLSIDWRREFFTTYLNPPYSKFIQWQYTVLREKGLITRGSHPVVWCPKEHKVVGDHDRPDEYAGIGPERVVIIKFKGEDGLVYPCLTYRPETVYGAVNIWVNPESKYLVAEVDGEKWVIGEYGARELADQDHSVKIVGEVKGSELVGRFARNPVTGWRIPVLPAYFVQADAGTGIVMSVPAHAPYDFAGLEDLKKDPYLLEKFGLDPAILDAVRPVKLIDVEEYGGLPAEEVVRRLGVTSQFDREKLEEATKEVYSKEFYKGVLKPEVFGERWGGRKVFEVKEDVVENLVSRGIALRHYTLPSPVYCRCGARTHVKLVKDQWFLRYSDPEWKRRAHECIDRMRFVPEEVRQEFHRLVDWYEDWACTHERELGTPLPWDERWVLESLSDSTIYMAYYTLAKYLQHPEKYGIDWSKLNNEFFDYVLLGKGDPGSVAERTGIPKELLEEMRKEFLYWYPVDMRVSGKDLIGNHLVFFIMHHVAIFPEEHWPRGIGVNGWVLVAGKKMSKSAGNFILLREALEYWGADATRFAEAYAGNSGLDDGNFEPEVASKAVDLLYEWYEFAVNNYGKGDENRRFVDDWFESVLYRTLEKVTKEYEELNTKNVLVEGFFNLQNAYRWYVKRRGGTANKEVLKKFVEIQTLILAPITPHIAEEIWEATGHKEFISRTSWPAVDKSKIKDEVEKAESIVVKLYEDIQEVLKLKKSGVERITIVAPSKWKYGFLEGVKRRYSTYGKLSQAISETIKEVEPSLKPAAGQLASLIQKNPEVLDLLVSPEAEQKALSDALEFLKDSLGVPVELVAEEELRENPRARTTLPGRPSIILS
ncbi:leucine--tRNA ligase [Thermofilum pendens]|uniref:Leucine--tRNA ligase n=1 Tax=Thermofilum pendens (strain DSM 2475 / Hrk 5) TaxID=368408 RepID=A1RXP3_THEPD|nr:leucine--tRNA ligase [Thermofilum pendens]ABL77973.1 leucyl-tRNA synthetase [Thermofilum pendens Hrk 5]